MELELELELEGSSNSIAPRLRLGGLSPVDCRIANNVCHPVVDLSWKASARSCPVATRHKRASSSCTSLDSVTVD